MRRMGAVLGSVLGPSLIWLSGKVLWIFVNDRLWLHPPSDGSTLILGQDITVKQLLWVPLQDTAAYILVTVFSIG